MKLVYPYQVRSLMDLYKYWDKRKNKYATWILSIDGSFCFYPQTSEYAASYYPSRISNQISKILKLYVTYSREEWGYKFLVCITPEIELELIKKIYKKEIKEEKNC